MKKTIVISAFPGCGKSHFFRENKDKIILDSDSSLFSWVEKGVRNPDFPNNYITHIKKNIGKADIILVSSHKVVRDALVENGIDFILVYPSRSIKNSYIQRYIDRGSDENFIKLLINKWDEFLDELENQKHCRKIELQKGQYLSDVIENINEKYRIKKFKDF